MATTALSVTGLPGKPHSFSPKAEAVPEAGPHTGLFTELSVNGLPGARHSFSAKTAAAEETGTHTGLFTSLSVIGLPGKRHSFIAKEVAEAIVEAVSGGGHGGGSWSMWDDPLKKDRVDPYKLIKHEDREIFEILEALTLLGIIE